jgi:hypothetical protein
VGRSWLFTCGSEIRVEHDANDCNRRDVFTFHRQHLIPSFARHCRDLEQSLLTL